MAIYISGVKNLPEQVQANKDNIATNTTAIATNTLDISNIKDEQITQNDRLTAVEGVASGEVIDRKGLIDETTLGGDDYTRVKGTNVIVKADDTNSYISIKGDDTLHIYQTQADDSGSTIQMSSTGVQIATSDTDGVIQGRINVKANGDIEISRQYEGTQYGKLLMTNQGLYYTDAQSNEFAMVNGNFTINEDTLIHHLYHYHIFFDDNSGTYFSFDVYTADNIDVSSVSEAKVVSIMGDNRKYTSSGIYYVGDANFGVVSAVYNDGEYVYILGAEPNVSNFTYNTDDLYAFSSDPSIKFDEGSRISNSNTTITKTQIF